MHESRETCFKALRLLGLCSIFSHNAFISPEAQAKITRLLTMQSTSSPHNGTSPTTQGSLEGGDYLIHSGPLKTGH